MVCITCLELWLLLSYETLNEVVISSSPGKIMFASVAVVKIILVTNVLERTFYSLPEN